MSEQGGAQRRDDLDPMTRAVSDALDEVLIRHHGIFTSWSNPESFLKWLGERGYVVVARLVVDESPGCSCPLDHGDDDGTPCPTCGGSFHHVPSCTDRRLPGGVVRLTTPATPPEGASL